MPAQVDVSPAYWSKRNVTRIYGKWLDLTEWASSHPGGSVAIALSVNRDSSAIFTSSHPFTKPAKLAYFLRELEVPAAVQPVLDELHPDALLEGAQFDWSSSSHRLTSARGSADPLGTPAPAAEPALPPPRMDAFEAEVRDGVLAYFEGEAQRRGVRLLEAIKAPPWRWGQYWLGLLLFLACCVSLVRGWMPALVLTPLVAWVHMVHTWHDASHFALSTNWAVNAFVTRSMPMFGSGMLWMHQHVLGHHSFTNIYGFDPDVHHSIYLMRCVDDHPWVAAHWFQVLYVPIVWVIAVPWLLLVTPVQAISSGAVNDVVKFWPLSLWRLTQFFAGRALAAFLVFFWPWLAFPGDLRKALLFSVVPIALYSIFFMLCTQINHHSDGTSSKAARHSNWYRHQCATSQNVGSASGFVFWFTGGLNLQIEHHLFPTVNHCHLHALQPIVRAAARAHGVPYPFAASPLEALGRLFSHISALAQPPSLVAGKV